MSQIYKNNTGGITPAIDLHVARFIVSAGGSADGANYTTITAAYAAAVAKGGNQTIFIQPGTYIENLTLSAGINLSAFSCDSFTPNVIINGKMTGSFTGNVSFSGIFFVNNSNNILSVLGAGACRFFFVSCWIQVGGTAVAIISTNNNAAIDFLNSQGDISGTNCYFSLTGGGINFENSYFFNGVISSTVNTLTGAAINIDNSTFNSPIIATGVAGAISIQNSQMILLNITLVTCNGTNNQNIIVSSLIDSNTATAITIGAGSTLLMTDSSIGSTNVSTISGSGVLQYSPISFIKSSSVVTVATQTPLRFGPQISPELANTNGTVIYDGTIIATIPPGTATNVLTSNGAGSPPSYQPASAGGISEFFSTYLSAPTANVTGDGTLYGPILFNGIISNSSGSYNAGTGRYTAPSTGKYCFQNTVCFNGGDINTQNYISLWNGSAFGARAFQLNPVAIAGSNTIIFSASIFINMTIGDTMAIQALAGGVTKNILIFGSTPTGAATTSLFSGFKVA